MTPHALGWFRVDVRVQVRSHENLISRDVSPDF